MARSRAWRVPSRQASFAGSSSRSRNRSKMSPARSSRAGETRQARYREPCPPGLMAGPQPPEGDDPERRVCPESERNFPPPVTAHEIRPCPATNRRFRCHACRQRLGIYPEIPVEMQAGRRLFPHTDSLLFASRTRGPFAVRPDDHASFPFRVMSPENGSRLSLPRLRMQRSYIKGTARQTVLTDKFVS